MFPDAEPVGAGALVSVSAIGSAIVKAGWGTNTGVGVVAGVGVVVGVGVVTAGGCGYGPCY